MFDLNKDVLTKQISFTIDKETPEYKIDGKVVSLEEFQKILEKHSLPEAKFYKCPLQNNLPTSPMTCMFCYMGHMTECHYPLSCSEAQCSHIQSIKQEDPYV